MAAVEPMTTGAWTRGNVWFSAVPLAFLMRDAASWSSMDLRAVRDWLPGTGVAAHRR
jgi:hypothetical protein